MWFPRTRDARDDWCLALFSADSAKDRSVANLRCLVVFLQPLGYFTTDRQIRQMVRRSGCAPQFNRSLPYQFAIWLLARSLRSGRGNGRMAIKPAEKILFDDRKIAMVLPRLGLARALGRASGLAPRSMIIVFALTVIVD